MHSPRDEHFEAIKWILIYHKGTPGRGLPFENHDHLQIEAYIDVDWAGNVMDRRSTLGYCTFVRGNLVSWKSKKTNGGSKE